VLLKSGERLLCTNKRDIIKIRDHDGTIGLLNISSIALANELGLEWIYIAVGVTILQIISPITQFCPVYTILYPIMPHTVPIQIGKYYLLSKIGYP
tara:strand:- start:1331 stop:1618 length:288 start_codon:yes stop_codon:yes gene_type:complete